MLILNDDHMGAFLVLSHIGYPFISKIKMSNNKNEIKYLEVKKKKKHKYLDVGAGEKDHQREAESETATESSCWLCSEGELGCCGGLCPGPRALIVSWCKCPCRQLTVVLSPGELSHPEVSELCSYMILTASVNWYDHGHFYLNMLLSLPEFEIISMSFFWENLTQGGFLGEWGGILD